MKKVLIKLFFIIWTTVIVPLLEDLVEKTDTPIDNAVLESLKQLIDELNVILTENQLK